MRYVQSACSYVACVEYVAGEVRSVRNKSEDAVRIARNEAGMYAAEKLARSDFLYVLDMSIFINEWGPLPPQINDKWFSIRLRDLDQNEVPAPLAVIHCSSWQDVAQMEEVPDRVDFTPFRLRENAAEAFVKLDGIICSVCKVAKPTEKFSRTERQRKDEPDVTCKSCQKRAKNPLRAQIAKAGGEEDDGKGKQEEEKE